MTDENPAPQPVLEGTLPILEARLYPPALPPYRVARPGLIRRLNQGLQAGRGMTLISAPAGFGKTVCALEWLQTLDIPLAWLSLESFDDDLIRFFTYLVASLRNLEPELAAPTWHMLRSAGPASEKAIYTSLLNDLQAFKRRFILALDDLQNIQDEAILEAIRALVSDAPRSAHILLITREDPPLPLARLRANNRLTEIRASELRFNSADARSFLKEVMGLTLSDSEAALLEARTEGWIAGLQLAGLALQAQGNQADRNAFIANLSGSHGYILNYLTEEVLQQQTSQVQEFLMQTAILDRFNADLCNAVTGRTDSRQLLEQVLSANLFLTPLDSQGDWYRYHQLFADLLRDRWRSTHKNEMDERHRRAARWYADRKMISEAIRHALSASDFSFAVALIETHALEMLTRWHIKTVENWIQAIPAEFSLQSPKANLAFAWLHLQRGNLGQLPPYLERLEAIFNDPAASARLDNATHAEWLALQSNLLTAQGRPAEALTLAKKALELAPENDASLRVEITMILAGAYQMCGDLAGSLEAYEMLVRYGRRAGQALSEQLGLSGLALIALQHGQLHRTAELAAQGIRLAERSGSFSPISGSLYGELAGAYFYWAQIEDAQDNFQRATQVSALSGYSDAEIFHAVIRSRLAQISGELDLAADELQKALDLMREDAPAQVREEVIAQQISLALAQGQLDSAELAFIHLSEGVDAVEYESQRQTANVLSEHLTWISAIRILLYRVEIQGETSLLETAKVLVDRLVDAAYEGEYFLLLVPALLLRAEVHALVQDENARLADVALALELAEPEGMVTIFVEGGLAVARVIGAIRDGAATCKAAPDYLEKVLAGFETLQVPGYRPAPKTSTRYDGLVEPLTERESEVLALMAEGLTYQEISARLYISLNTVRTHVKAVYGKLGVNNRTRAIEFARQRQLL